MIVFDDANDTIILDSIHTSTPTEYCWVLDLTLMDFVLTPLLSLEEIVSPSLKIRVKDFEFILPASWNVLVYDTDTSQLDIIELSETCGKEFTAFVYGPQSSYPSPGIITVVDYYVEHKNVGPLLNKQQMLCHPIGPEEWITVAPADGFNKYLKDKMVGDLILN